MNALLRFSRTTNPLAAADRTIILRTVAQGPGFLRSPPAVSASIVQPVKIGFAGVDHVGNLIHRTPPQAARKRCRCDELFLLDSAAILMYTSVHVRSNAPHQEGVEMPPATSRTTMQRSAQSHHPAPDSLCPVCSGFLIPLGGQVRCSRCYFTFCVGCEGVAPESSSEPDAEDVR